MASWKKVKKIRRTKADKLLKEIKSYGLKFTYKLWGGECTYGIKSEDYGLTITFKDLPDVQFGIWKNTDYTFLNQRDYFFAEHIVYLDKFYPSRVPFNWSSIDEMMHAVSYWVKCKNFYKKDMIAAYEIEDWDEFCQYAIDQHYRNSHHNMDRDEFIRNNNKFNQIIASVDISKIDVIWKKSTAYHNLYDVYSYYSLDVSDEEINAFEESLEDCGCFVWGTKSLPPYYWSHRKKYKYKIHKGNKKVYTNRKLHEKWFK